MGAVLPAASIPHRADVPELVLSFETVPKRFQRYRDSFTLSRMKTNKNA
jgi:hypothetical protein